MGQAKDRGTREERIALAIAKKELGHKRDRLQRIGNNAIGVIGRGHRSSSILLGMAAAMGGPMGAGLDNPDFYGVPTRKK